MEHLHENLNEEQSRILEALLTYPCKADAARALGISRSTLYRKLREGELKEAERDARTLALSDATASLQNLAREAAVTLSVIMGSSDAPYSARVAAASKLLDLAYRSFELENVASEV